MTLEEELRFAAKAKALLEDEVFQEVFKRLDEALLSGIRQSAFNDDKLRERLCMRYDLLHSLRDQIEAIVQGGALAEAELRQKSVAERAREAWRAFTG